MRVRFTLLCGAMLACLTALAATAGEPSVKGRGVVRIELENSHEGSTYVLMGLYVNITKGEQTKGRLVFAGEDHDHGDGGGHGHGQANSGPSAYPGRVVHLHHFDKFEIHGDKVMIEGMGTLNGLPIHVHSHIVSKPDGDEVHVRCTKHGGEVVYERHGKVVAGKINVTGGSH